ncbi:YebG family protein (plasmid) [Enterobacter ludwigii]
MAVETKYVVVRKGEEKMTFANKKDADAWDKMLDMADAFTDWLQQHQPELGEAQAEALGLLLAEQKDAVQHILRTSKRPDVVKRDVADAEEPAEASTASDAETEAAAPEKKVRAVKAA